MNGEGFDYALDQIGYVLNQPVVQQASPADVIDMEGGQFVSGPEFDMETAAYTPPPLTEEQPVTNNLVNVFGKVLDVAGKTYQQLATKKEIANFKSTPYVTSALNTLGYPTARTAQTGIDTGMLVAKAPAVKQALASMSFLSPMVLLIGAGLFIVLLKWKG